MSILFLNIFIHTEFRCASFGTDFSNHLDEIETTPVQMGFKFERVNNWGGFINRKVFFVHLSNDYKVTKIDFDK